MNGLARITAFLFAAALLALAAVVGPAFAESGSGHEGSGSGDQSRSGHGDGAEQSGDLGEGTPQEHGSKGKRKGHSNGELPEAETPEQGEHLNADLEHGVVLVRMPGTHRTLPLHGAASLPVGAVVDARHGAVTFVTVPNELGEPQEATFSGSIFQVNQPHGVRYTELRLRGGKFSQCSTRRPAARRSVFGRSFLPLATMSRKPRHRRRRAVRRLWGKGHGHFRTRGRNGAATVRGTVWMTADRCDGTLVRVKRGLVDVRDFARRKDVSVPAGHSYLARR